MTFQENVTQQHQGCPGVSSAEGQTWQCLPVSRGAPGNGMHLASKGLGPPRTPLFSVGEMEVHSFVGVSPVSPLETFQLQDVFLGSMNLGLRVRKRMTGAQLGSSWLFVCLSFNVTLNTVAVPWANETVAKQFIKPLLYIVQALHC